MSYETTIQVEPYALPYTLEKYSQERTTRIGFALIFLLVFGVLALQRPPFVASAIVVALGLVAYALHEYDLLKTRHLSVSLDETALNYKDLKREYRIQYAQFTCVHVRRCQDKGGVYFILTLMFDSTPFASPLDNGSALSSTQNIPDFRQQVPGTAESTRTHSGITEIQIPLRMVLPQSRVILLHVLTTRAPQATVDSLAARMASGEFSPQT